MKRVVLAFVTALALSGKCGGDVITYLRFEEGSGTIAADQTGLMDGELIGIWDASEGWRTDVPTSVVPLTGQPNNYSLRFGGGSEYVDLSNANTLSLGTDFTVEFYMKPESVIISSVAYAFSDGAGHGIGFQIADLSGSLIYLYGFDNGSEDLVFYEPAPQVVFGEWQHVAIVKQPGQSTIYLNGLIVAQNTFAANTDPYILPGNVILGTRTIGNESGGTWRGYIDEFRISDEALTPGQFLIAPEPSTIFLLGIGAVALALHSRRPCRQKRKGQPSAALLRLTRGGSTEGEP